MAKLPVEFGTPRREPRNMGAGVERHVCCQRGGHTAEVIEGCLSPAGATYRETVAEDR